MPTTAKERMYNTSGGSSYEVQLIPSTKGIKEAPTIITKSSDLGLLSFISLPCK